MRHWVALWRFGEISYNGETFRSSSIPTMTTNLKDLIMGFEPLSDFEHRLLRPGRLPRVPIDEIEQDETTIRMLKEFRKLSNEGASTRPQSEKHENSKAALVYGPWTK